MRKTVNINVGGFAFVIEEQAYELLSNYLDRVRYNLGADVDANEVMSDIEMRIAELFKEELRSTGKEVVESSTIDKIIGIMGKPEDYGNGQESQQQHEQHAYQDNAFDSKRTLYRDTENSMLGGVASGIGHYMNWDPVLVRIIFLLLLFGFGTGVIVYIVLWIIIPPAKSTADKLRMQGKPVNVDTIKERFNTFKGEINSLNSKEGKQRMRQGTRSIGSNIERLFSGLGEVLGKVVGVVFMIIGVIIFASVARYLITGDFVVKNQAAQELFFNHHDLLFDNPGEYYALIVGVCVLSVMLLYVLIKTGIELLFDVKFKNKPLKYATMVVTIAAVLCIAYGGTGLGRNFVYDESVSRRYDLPLKDSALAVDVLPDIYFNDKISAVETDREELIKVDGSRIVFGYPSLTIELSQTGKAYAELRKIASGRRKIKAVENSEAIDYRLAVDSGVIALPANFSTPAKNKFREQRVDIIVYLPKGTYLVNKRNMQRIFDPYGTYMAGENEINRQSLKYKMTQNGLIIVE